MSDYIKREDAIFIALQQPIYSLVSEIKQLKGIDLDDYVPREFHDKTCEAMAKAHQAEILELTADRPQGEWVSNHDGSWNCSECGLRVLIYAKGNYCPNCGARMKGADDE